MRYILGALAATGKKYPIAHGSYRIQLGMFLHEKAISAAADIKQSANGLGIRLRLQSAGQNDHIHRQLYYGT